MILYGRYRVHSVWNYGLQYTRKWGPPKSPFFLIVLVLPLQGFLMISRSLLTIKFMMTTRFEKCASGKVLDVPRLLCASNYIFFYVKWNLIFKMVADLTMLLIFTWTSHLMIILVHQWFLSNYFLDVQINIHHPSKLQLDHHHLERKIRRQAARLRGERPA